MDDTQTQVRSVLATHYDGCWREHLECAVLRVAMLEKQLREANELQIQTLLGYQRLRSIMGQIKGLTTAAMENKEPE